MVSRAAGLSILGVGLLGHEPTRAGGLYEVSETDSAAEDGL
jgi:hypothetical protein